MRASFVRFMLLLLTALGAATGRAGAEDHKEPAAADAFRCVVTGRIVDGYEGGVRDAEVTWIGDAPTGDRSSAAAIRTDASGRFVLEVSGPADEELRGTIHAMRGDDAATYRSVRVRVGALEYDAGSLALTAARALEIAVRREDAPVPDAAVWLWGWAGNMYHGRPAFLGTATTGSSGRAAFDPVPHAYVKMLVQAPDGSVGERTRQVVPGSAASRLRVSVGPSRAVRVLVTNDADPPLPIAGAHVTRHLVFALEDVIHTFAVHVPRGIAPTQGDGSVRVDGLPADETVDLRARVAGRPVGRTRCRPGERTATIVVPGPTVIPVTAGERSPPPDGTKLLVRYRRWRRATDAPVEAWMKNGAIAVPLSELQLNPGLAVAPDGSLALLKGLDPTSFFQPRSLVVRIVEPDGRGVAGTRVELSPDPYLEGHWNDPVPTDAGGRARFSGLAPTKHHIYAFPTPQRPHGRKVGEVDLRPGDATRDVVVGDERSILARVSVDGRAAIPRSLWWKIARGIVVDSTVDRATGVVRFRVRPEEDATASGSIRFGGEGVRTREVAFTWPDAGETASIDAALLSSPQVIVDVLSDPDSDAAVYLEKWCPWSDDHPWLAARDAYPHLRGRTRIELESGRYRLHDQVTGVLSEPFDVPEHGGRVQATLDLTGLVTIRGRVDLPDGLEETDVLIGVEGEGIDAHMEFTLPFLPRRGFPTDGGAFAVRVPAGRPVTLRPMHASLQPVLEGGEVTLVGPRDDLVLRMGEGATVVMTLADADGEPLPSRAREHPRIAAVPSDHPSRPAVVVGAEPVEGKPGTVSASGLPFGTLDLWVSTRYGYAGRRLERVRVAGDTVDLGEVRMTRGSRVTVRKIDEEGGRVRIDGGFAVAMRGPRSWIFFDQLEDADVVGRFKGLGAGRWYVRINGVRKTPWGDVQEKWEREIDVDGENDQMLDVDFGK